MTLVSQTLAFLGALLYASFFEWFVHKHLMHSTKWLREPFERHAVLHHGMHRSLRSFFARASDNPQYMLVEASFFPIVWVLHIPLYLGFNYFVAPHTGIGIALGTACYCVAYEVIHWCEHVPRNRWIERTRVFRFLLEHHRIHHLYPRKNYNVVCPLADLMLRTLSTQRLGPEPDPDTLPPHIIRKLDAGPKMGRRAVRPTTSDPRRTTSTIQG
jgi:hypothetical protein